ncbi:YXWGXW repeat-containing protein [Terracidiphilus sp.]|uniref:YXWGXW repeat-containing protein n=1 Tax=Terracidiphilus sp. TaxID=1964191 RepID=UPI003C26A272
MKKFALAALLGLSLLPAALNAQVVVRIAPPVAVVEHPGPRPGPGYEWVAGYHRWDGARYVWVPGRYDRPPHAGAHWVAHRWVHRNGGYVLQEGHWR